MRVDGNTSAVRITTSNVIIPLKLVVITGISNGTADSEAREVTPHKALSRNQFRGVFQLKYKITHVFRLALTSDIKCNT